MFPDYTALSASNGSGEPVRATVLSAREIGSADIDVNAITNYPTGTFIATTGTLQANGTLNPATVQVFYGTATDDTVTIVGFAEGYTDLGNAENDIVVIKPTTEWANTMAEAVASFASAGVPSGGLMPFAGATAPSGWLLCQGQAISRTTYAHLFSVISTTYGTGDGSTTFNVPDMRGNVPAGYKSGDANFGSLGQTGGSTDIMEHSHGVNDPGHGHGVNDPGHSHSWTMSGSLSFVQNVGTGGGLDYSGAGGNWRYAAVTGSNGGSGTGIGIDGSGTGISIDESGTGANNLTPYNTFQYIIKV
jgi:microcystin-dependent protein